MTSRLISCAVIGNVLNPPPQITSIEEADKKMEELANSGKIDPAFLQVGGRSGGRTDGPLPHGCACFALLCL
jgi:hypothetical protein